MVALKEGAAVWVKDEAIAKDNLYNIGHVVAIDENKVTVETEANGKRQEIVVPSEECYHTNQGGDVPDHCQLVHLSPPTLLENTRVRFAADKIYTYVGDILVAINPFKWIPGIYDESKMDACKGRKLHNAPCGPHVFAISEKAFVQLKKSGASQCVVVSGESGAGKTETNKQLMNYLVYRGSSGGGTSDLTDKIMAANPILEGFGNAKTTRNKNSSRFGRYVLVRFSSEFQVIGAQVRTFLLERSRVTASSNAGERAYHVLYQLVCDGRHVQPSEPSAHKYLSLSGCVTIEGVDDVKDFAENHAALLAVGMGDAEVGVMWGMVASMLLLGNLNYGDGATAALSNPAAVTQIEGLLGVTGLAQLLLTRSIKVGNDVTRIEHEPKQAAAARDALVKIMYARLFDYLVTRINMTVDADDKSDRYIGLLDVYGFEFFQVNSFEQLCINFANEKLQQFFLTTVFANEANTYKEEGVPWTPIAYADNKAIISLCEEAKIGIYPTLDEQCRTPKTTGKTFCTALHKVHAKSPVFAAPKVSRKETRSKDDHFIVKHFAGDVVYFSGEFLEKNNDSLDGDVEAALIGSSHSLVATVCTPEPEAGGAKKKKTAFASVGDKFVKSLRTLMSELALSTALFVRCIKPNPELKPSKIHGASVIDQLRMSGTLDAVRLIQAGYPSRIPYDDLYMRYRELMPANVQNLPAAEFCELIAAVCDIGKDEYALGVSRMFFKLGSAALLEELADLDPVEAGPILQEKLKLFEKKRKARPIVEKTLHMYKVLVAEKRRIEAEKRRLEEEARRKEEEARKRREEEERREAEAEQRRKDEEAAKAAAAQAEAEKCKAKAASNNCSEKEQKAADEKAAAACVAKLQAADAKVHELEESHDDVHAAVQGYGGVTGVIGMASEHAASSDVQTYFVGLMRDLCVSDEIADEIAAAGGVERILDAAHRHYDSPDVIMEVADALRNLTCGAHIAQQAAGAGGVEVLVDACTRHAANDAVARAVVGALWSLSVHDALVPDLVRLGAVQAVLKVAKAQPEDEDVQSSAAALIRNLASSEEVRWCVAEKGGIGVLLTAAEHFPKATEVASQVACALWNLAQTPDVAREVAGSGAVDVLVHLAEQFVADPAVQLGVAGCLRLVCLTDAAADMVVTAGGLQTLLTASRSHLKRADVQRAFVGALLELANHGFSTTLVEAEAIAAVLRVAETHAKEDRLQARCANVVRLLAVDDASKKAIGEHGGIGLLLAAAKRFPQSAAVQADVAGALAVLAVDDTLEGQIGASGGISVLTDALNRFQTSKAVAAHGWHALTNLSVSPATKRQLAEASTLKSLVAGTLQAHANAPRVLEGVATTVRNVCDGGTPAKVLDASACPQLVATLKKYHGTTLVEIALCGAMRALAADPAHAAQFEAAGARDVLAATEAAHKDDERLTREVASVIRRLDDAAAGVDVASRKSEAKAPTKTRLPFGAKRAENVTPGSLKNNLSSRLNTRKSKGDDAEVRV